MVDVESGVSQYQVALGSSEYIVPSAGPNGTLDLPTGIPAGEHTMRVVRARAPGLGNARAALSRWLLHRPR